ncbi:MAG: cation:proton antiporter [Hyphomonas sp.]|uniref:cation:proton antiporter n=1 Tax=Hyphomonas sp. TaxID=87 RepID=UPI0017FF9926|nr:cation:proton antiporter [Hyphomonas sp.]MBU3922543.1 cation:proton antiporter [Alphaproteobacteria bacterium]MBA3067702.1 cation:proton antiporter [Hyphomonas sp.]MBU4062211.1 cation:proton antiporter [Alphaproteobacteria bacterium]MBU4165646.1 cation:proton antiporter [Alphaproteobacteria bacterium]MBU4568203.1 cation:proton antiporter [Alphaproteobacteria bacterium]
MTISITEVYLIAMLIIFTVPYLVWRLGRTEYFAPLVVVQILCGILLGPGVLGAAFPAYYNFVFQPDVIRMLNGVATWAVMIFVWIAGIELDLKSAWKNRGETGSTAALALTTPLLLGCGAAWILLQTGHAWMGPDAAEWQFILGIGMACAVTALPILVLFLEKLEILRTPLGQRILRYASLDDIAIWAVLAAILLDWERIGRQAIFLVIFAAIAFAVRKLLTRIPQRDRWYAGLIWMAFAALVADWSGLHYMVGAFLAGAVIDRDTFDEAQMDLLRNHILLAIMPVFFLSTGLRTEWEAGGMAVFGAAALLLVASVAGKLAGVKLAGLALGWKKGEASLIGWLLQTKALIMIIFANILLDRDVITNDAFTACLLMAAGSTMLTMPFVAPMLKKRAPDG